MPFRGVSAHLLTGERREVWIQRCRDAKLGDKNPLWKGENVGYGGIHEWVRSRMFKPKWCQRCNARPAFDLANRSGLYARDLNDWWWLCRRCHMELDGRLEQLNPKLGWFQDCRICGEPRWVTPHLVNDNRGNYCSRACANKGRVIHGVWLYYELSEVQLPVGYSWWQHPYLQMRLSAHCSPKTKLRGLGEAHQVSWDRNQTHQDGHRGQVITK